LGGVQPNKKVTDPPYGVEYDPGWRDGKIGKDSQGKTVRVSSGMARRLTRTDAVGTVENDNHADWSAAWALFPGSVAYIWHGQKQLVSMASQLGGCEFATRNLIVWANTARCSGGSDASNSAGETRCCHCQRTSDRELE